MMSGFFWKSRRHRDDRQFVLDVVEVAENVAAHVELDLARDQQQAAVRHRPAGQDFDVEAVFLIGAVDQGLIIAAGFGVGEPVGAERHFVERLAGARPATQRRHRRENHPTHCRFPTFDRGP